MDAEKRPILFWRILLYIIFYILIIIIAEIAATLFETIRILVYPIVYIGGIYLLTRLQRRLLDKRSWDGIRLPPIRRGGWLSLIGGFTLGGIMIILVFITEYAAGWIHIVGYEMELRGIIPAMGSLLVGVILCIQTGFSEEIMFRGYIFQNLGERYPIWGAILANGILFGVLHFTNTGFNPMFIISAVVISAFLIVTRLSTGSIWFAIGWHTAWNWMQGDILGLSNVGVQDFGHALLHVEQAGPSWMVGISPSIEGGILIILVELLALSINIFWSAQASLIPNWRARLDASGKPVDGLRG